MRRMGMAASPSLDHHHPHHPPERQATPAAAVSEQAAAESAMLGPAATKAGPDSTADQLRCDWDPAKPVKAEVGHSGRSQAIAGGLRELKAELGAGAAKRRKPRTACIDLT